MQHIKASSFEEAFCMSRFRRHNRREQLQSSHKPNHVAAPFLIKLIARRAIPQPSEPFEPFEPSEPSHPIGCVQWRSRHHNPRSERPSNLRTLRTLGAKPRQPSHRKRVEWRPPTSSSRAGLRAGMGGKEFRQYEALSREISCRNAARTIRGGRFLHSAPLRSK